MTDVHTKKVRSYNMSRIRSKDTKPELIVRKFLFAQGFRFRLHVKNMPGRPDIVLPKYRTVIFVHGCFWHGHTGCKYFVIPKTKTEWWTNKISRNRMIDVQSVRKLKANRWSVITVFECGLKKVKVDSTLQTVVKKLETNEMRNKKLIKKNNSKKII